MMVTTLAARPFHLLLIAPSAPPKNSAEAMQVGRFLDALDPAVRVTLVTTPIVRGWEWEDASLASTRPGMQVIVPELPFHKLTRRVLGNHRLAAMHTPDPDFWLPWLVSQVIERLDGVPDVIYSRSAPFSAALLARRLKARLHCPWLMHLSDPWSGSPYRPMADRQAAKDRILEEGCVADADRIALTSQGQADYYRVRYPDRARNIVVTPNMMSSRAYSAGVELQSRQRNAEAGELMLVHTGALYGDRSPGGLLQALGLLVSRAPALAKRIHVRFIGNMSPEIAKLIDSTPSCTREPPISFLDASRAQCEADLVVSIEPQSEEPVYTHFLLSKVVDYLSTGRPILALTPPDSLTSAYCNKGYGWAFSPDDADAIASFLERLLRDSEILRNLTVPPPPAELAPRVVVHDIEMHLRQLISGNAQEDRHEA